MTNNSHINVFLLPSGNKNNKYIDLLSSSLRGSEERVDVIALKNDSLFRIAQYFFSRETKGAHNIIHIQWSSVLYGSRFLLKSFFLLLLNTCLLFIIKIFFKFKIVWTVHNFFAHDYPHPFIDAMGRRALFAVSHSIVVQQQSTLADYRIRFPRKNVQYVPHGNYIGVYGPAVDRDSSLRSSLGFTDKDILFLSLGAMAPYKLNENIIDAVVAAQKVCPNIKLLIAGKGNEQYVETLIQRAAPHGGIVIKNGFIPDADLPKYLSVADYSVFYYDKSEMTSGGMILSLSYGVPVVAREIPATEIISDKNGRVFDNEIGLVEILKQIGASFVLPDRRGIIDDIRHQDWASSALELADIYNNL